MTTEELVASLGNPLGERARSLDTRAVAAGADFVLYWMRTSVRIDENPALNTAVAFANKLGLPVLVYHALSERYRYASDRHHSFILQGAKDVQAALAATEINYAFHLESPTDRGPHLRTLAERAAVVVTEEMPVEPLRGWTRALGRGMSTPLVAVDTACVVPMQLVGRAYERAFAFRKATRMLYAERPQRPPLSFESPAVSRIAIELPLQPIDLAAADIAELVSQCEIDHAIGPDRVHLVAHSMGGIIARRALALQRPMKLGRFVMLGPPNSGSHVARRLSSTLGRVCPALRELSDAAESYVNRLDEPAGVDLGIIAAESDRVVRLPSTYLKSQTDHIILPGHHGMLTWRRDTSQQVTHFLRNGHFLGDPLRSGL